LPPLDARIMAEPAAMPVTTPAGETVATDPASVDHEIAPTLMGAPFWSSPLTVAVAV